MDKTPGAIVILSAAVCLLSAAVGYHGSGFRSSCEALGLCAAIAAAVFLIIGLRLLFGSVKEFLLTLFRRHS